MAKDNGYSAAKGARAAARKVLGSNAVEGAEFEVFSIEGDRFDWKAVEVKRAKRRTSSKGNPFNPPAPAAAPVTPHPALDTMPLPGAAASEETSPETEPENDHKPSAAASAFGAFANGQLGNCNDRRTDSSTGGRRSDKPAAERKVRTPPEIVNGVRKPSVGTVCREVWDELEKLRTAAGGVAPDSKAVKALAESKGWNANNASIEFYQWRKFNGITGRSKPAAPAAKPVKAKSE